MGDDSLNGTLPKSVTDVSSLDPRSNAAVFLQAASMVIIMLVAVVGNLLILAAIYIDKTLQTITNAFIINLACADLFLSIIGMPFTLASSIKYEWVFGDTWCKVNGMANSLFCIASILTLAAVSIDRYCAILYPFKYATWITSKVAAGMIVYIWFHALLMACLPLTSWSQYTFIRSESICTVQWEYSISFTLFLFSVCFFLPLGVMMITYLRIFRTAREQSRKIVPVTGEIEAREDPSITEYSACYRDDDSRACLNPELLTACSVKEFDTSKSDISLNNSDADKMIPGRQTAFAVFDERKEIGVLSNENVHTTDQPSKDSGCEDINLGGSRTFLKPNELPTSKEPRRTFSVYESVDGESVFNSSCESLQESVWGPREPLDRKAASASLDSSDVNTPFSKSNNIATHRKTGAIYLPPIETVKRKEEIESITQRFDFYQTRATLGSLNNNNQNVNEMTKHGDAKCVDEYPSFAIETTAKKEDNSVEDNMVNQSNCPPTEGNTQDQRQHAASDLADNKLFHIPVVVSRFSSQSSFAYSTKEAPSAAVISASQTLDRNPSATRRKKFSTASFASLANFSGPNAFRAFSKSSLALVKLRKKKDVQSRAKMRRETKAAKTLLTVVGTFVLCWTPHFIGIFCFLFENCSWPDEFFAVTTWLAMLNSACNPVIYGVMSRQFRKRFKQILQCKRGFF